MLTRAHGTPVLINTKGAAPLVPAGHELAEQSIDEDFLQRIIHSYPNLLPIAEIEPGFGRLHAICREFPTKHGPVDNLLMTADGNLVLVEVKLWRNPEARRKVVAQALDYASCLLEMSYEDLESAVLRVGGSQNPSPSRLIEFIPDAERQTETLFVDAVSANLRRGRVLVLVVGDGVREEAERLGQLLQSHITSSLTFAMVELGLYRLGEGDDILVCPRTLLRTETIVRGIVEINDTRAVPRLPTATPGSALDGQRSTTITSEQFFEVIASLDVSLPSKLNALIQAVEPLGVYVEIGASLMLKWQPPAGKPINLGYITRKGVLWTDAVTWFIPPEFSRSYLNDLANTLGTEVFQDKDGRRSFITVDGKPPNISSIKERLDLWPGVIARFQVLYTDYLHRSVE